MHPISTPKVKFLADSLSRSPELDMSDFKLNTIYFEFLCRILGSPTIDLFASQHTNQRQRFVSWQPDPYSIATDAFTILWDEFFHAFSPFCLIGRLLQKIVKDNATGIVVVPNWPSQYWFPKFKQLAVSDIMELSNSDLLFCPYFNRTHQLSHQISLVCAVLSGIQK